MILLKKWVAFIVVTIAITSFVRADVSHFTRYAEFETVSISPEGKHLAITHRDGSFERLIVLDRASMQAKVATHFGEKISISNIVWASERYLLVQPERRFPGLTDYTVPTGEIGVIDLETGRSELIFGFRAGKKQLGTHIKRTESTKASGRVLDILRDEPNEVLIETIPFFRAGSYGALLRLDLRTGRTTQVARSPVHFGNFAPDLHNGNVLVAGQNDEGGYEVYLRKRESRKFERIHETKLLRGSRRPIAPADATGSFLFADSAKDNTRGVISWNPIDGALEERFRHDVVDYRYTMRTPQHELWGVMYHDHFPKYHYPNPAHPLAQMHTKFASTFPNLNVEILNMTDDHSTGIVHVSGPTHAGSFFVADLVNFEFINKLEARSWLKDTKLAEVLPLEYEARDGLTIRALLTLPPGRDKNLPMVVMVHGGPHGPYDRWEFNWRAQLLASEGYAVLQVNYRGSGGRGGDFQSRGFGRWGREMQDDVTDGVRFTIQQGTANPDRICIYGASYGAYSALTGAFRDPDLYRCAIGVAGVYDLELLFEAGDIRRSLRGVNYLKKAVGDDRDDLISRSPVHNAGKIDIPVLLVHGKLDLRAPIKHAQRMRKALKKAGNPPQWHVEKREGHGIFGEENRVVVYEKMLEFLKQHLSASAADN